MFGGFFNRMYYGNPNKSDLKKEDLPEKGIKLFFTVLQVRFWKLIQLNLLYSAFWVPSFFLIYTNFLAIARAPHILDTFNNMDSIIFTILLFLVPLIAITGPATAGTTYVIRNWARDEHAWLWSDFKDAWKQNWKESLIIALINSITLLILYLNMIFYGNQGDKNILFVILRYIIIMMGVTYGMMNIFIFPMLVTYKLKIREILKNAFIFTIVELPKTFLIFVLAMSIYGVIFYFSLHFILPFIIIGLTFPMLVSISFANWVFDKYLNKKLDGKGNIRAD